MGLILIENLIHSLGLMDIHGIIQIGMLDNPIIGERESFALKCMELRKLGHGMT